MLRARVQILEATAGVAPGQASVTLGGEHLAKLHLVVTPTSREGLEALHLGAAFVMELHGFPDSGYPERTDSCLEALLTAAQEIVDDTKFSHEKLRSALAAYKVHLRGPDPKKRQP